MEFGTRTVVTVALVVLVQLVGSELGGVTQVEAGAMPVNYGDWAARGSGALWVKREVTPNEVVKKEEAAKNASAVPGSNATDSGKPAVAVTPRVKEKTLIIEDRTPKNYTRSNQATKDDSANEDEEEGVTSKHPAPGEFDEKAVQRTIIVIAGIAVIIIAYLGIKLVLIKRRKVVKRYGRVEASELDLLDEMEDDDESEEEELFDINQHQQRRS